MTTLSYTDVERSVREIVSKMDKDGWVPAYIVAVEDACVPAVMMGHLIDCEVHHMKMDGSWYPWIAEDMCGVDGNDQLNVLFLLLEKDCDFISTIKKDMKSACMPNDKKWDDIWNHVAHFATLTFTDEPINYSGSLDDSDISYPWEMTS